MVLDEIDAMDEAQKETRRSRAAKFFGTVTPQRKSSSSPTPSTPSGSSASSASSASSSEGKLSSSNKVLIAAKAAKSATKSVLKTAVKSFGKLLDEKDRKDATRLDEKDLKDATRHSEVKAELSEIGEDVLDVGLTLQTLDQKFHAEATEQARERARAAERAEAAHRERSQIQIEQKEVREAVRPLNHRPALSVAVHKRPQPSALSFHVHARLPPGLAGAPGSQAGREGG